MACPQLCWGKPGYHQSSTLPSLSPFSIMSSTYMTSKSCCLLKLCFLTHQLPPWWALQFALQCRLPKEAMKMTVQLCCYQENNWLVPLLPLQPLWTIFTLRSLPGNAWAWQRLSGRPNLARCGDSPICGAVWGLLISLDTPFLKLHIHPKLDCSWSSTFSLTFHRCQTYMWLEASPHLLQFLLPINLLYV